MTIRVKASLVTGSVVLKRCLLLVMTVGLVTACSGSESSPRPLAAGANSAPEGPTSTPAAGPLTLRVMSYNVLWGGGLERRFDENLLQWQKPLFTGRNRLPQIIELLQAQKPDVLGVQEAAGWDEDGQRVAQQVATNLGMDFVLAPNDYEINTALYSRFPIAATLDLTPYMGSNSAVVAVLVMPDRRPLVVAVAHLDPFTSRMRACQVDLILSVLQPLGEHRVLLLGDMNFRPTSGEFRKLVDAGWEPLVIEQTLPIDYIWTRSGEGVTSEPLWPAEAGLGVVDGQRLSDHYPVGALVTFPEATASGPGPELRAPGTKCAAP